MIRFANVKEVKEGNHKEVIIMDDNNIQTRDNGDGHSITRIALVWHQDHDQPMGAWINGHSYCSK